MQANDLTHERLRRLASIRPGDAKVLSFFVNLDPREFATASARSTEVRSLLDRAARLIREDDELSHTAQTSLRADLERIESELGGGGLDAKGAQGLAVFTASAVDLFEVLKLSEPVDHDPVIADAPFIEPLSAIGPPERWCALLVNRRVARLFCGPGAALEEVELIEDDVRNRHDQGGWSQANYQRHIEKLVHEHLRAVAEELDRLVRSMPATDVVVVASEETRAEFSDLMANGTRNAVVGWTQAEAHATPTELLELVTPLLEQSRAERERKSLERWREEAGRNGRAASGWADTLEAASDGRVELLLFGEGASRPAWQCPACGRAALEQGSCPLDGTRMEPRDEGLDLAVHQTLAHGGTVLAVRHQQDLEPVEGLAALLRY